MPANAFGSHWAQLDRQNRAYGLPPAANSKTMVNMKIGCICKDGEVIELPSLTAVIQRKKAGMSPPAPNLGVASHGKKCKEAYARMAEAVELWLEAASVKEIKRRLKMGGSVQPRELAHA